MYGLVGSISKLLLELIGDSAAELVEISLMGIEAAG